MDKRGRGSIMIFRQRFVVSQYQKIRRGTIPGFRKILVSKLFMHKRGRVSRFSVKIVLSRSTEKIRRGTPL